MSEYYSQGPEEGWILEKFSGVTSGRFLDLGAYNPKVFSNTRALYELGWGGVMVEASPLCMKSLRAEYENVDRITLVEKAVKTGGPRVAPIQFWESANALATTCEETAKEFMEKRGATFTLIEVPAISTGEIFQEYGDAFDFISIDVEGISGNIFTEALDIVGPGDKCRMICVEHDNQMVYLREYARKYGFDVWDYDGNNLLIHR
jgi:FkbM family methyltransferase